MDLLEHERDLWQQKYKYIAGIDEAGRGPLAGPVVVSAVVFKPGQNPIEGVNDSKKLTHKQRELSYERIVELAVDFVIIFIDHQEIDKLNILGATYKAMQQAAKQLKSVDYLLIDGKRGPVFKNPNQCIIKGDSKSMSIAAASILAKVSRDRAMVEYDKIYPQYGFAQHKGYPTKGHIAAIREHGFCDIHRRSFHPKALEDIYETL